MKKSSLITVALASLVGLVACNKPAAGHTSEGFARSIIDKYYRTMYSVDDEGYFLTESGQRIRSEDGSYLKVEVEKGEVTEGLFGANGLIDVDEAYEMTYYLIPECQNSYAFILPGIYEGVTAEQLAAVASDGNVVRDNVLSNTAFYSWLFGMHKGTFDELYHATQMPEGEYEDTLYIPVNDEIVGLLDVDEDGDSDYGVMRLVDAKSDEEGKEEPYFYLELYAFLFPVTDSTTGAVTYSSACQVNVYDYATDMAE